MSTTELTPARVAPARELAPVDVSPIDSFTLLDVYAGGIVTDEEPRPDAIATISAGFREEPRQGEKLGYPAASRDGRIYFHGDPERAPGLLRALKASEAKTLTIAFPFNDPRAFIQQRFMLYSASSLLAYGDERSIHTITPKTVGEGKSAVTTATHADLAAGTAEYAAVVARCKVSASVYFALADWTDDGKPLVVFPDGAGALYRLRFTSRHSLRSIVNTLRQVSQFTRGQLAGVPFELRLDYREVADKVGAKRKIPVWVIAMKTPQAIALSSGNFASIMEASLEQGKRLMLTAPPRPETLEMAALETPALDLDELEISDADADRLQRGGLCDAAYYKRLWGVTVDGSDLDDDDRRAVWMLQATQGRYYSLADFLAQATDAEAAALLGRAVAYLHPDLRVEDEREDERMPVVLPSSATNTAMDRAAFITAAIQEFELDGHMAIAKALGVKVLNAWLDGGRTWADAWDFLVAQRAAAEAARTPEEAEADELTQSRPDDLEDTVPEACEGCGSITSQGEPHDQDCPVGAPDADVDSEGLLDQPETLTRAPSASEPITLDALIAEAEGQRDPLHASAQEAIRAIRTRVEEVWSREKGEVSPALRRSLLGVLRDELKLDMADVSVFLREVFGVSFKSVDDLTKPQVVALMSWATASNGRARQQASTLVQLSGVRR